MGFSIWVLNMLLSGLDCEWMDWFVWDGYLGGSGVWVYDVL